MELCSTSHPERPDVVCDKPKPCWVYHANARARVTWNGIPLPPTQESVKKGGSAKGRLALIAKRAQ